jgi:AraC-like DNA-binding protein
MPAYQRLMTLMEEGAYRKEGLTVAALAEQVGVPEHQLRRLINRELGFRNFSAFLNERRIADAKTMLAAPENAKKQILQIALDHGYGSIAPFNRAFKDATGKTPSEFRREALEQADQI